MTTDVSEREMVEIELGPSKYRDNYGGDEEAQEEALDAFDEEKPSEAGRSMFHIAAITLTAISLVAQIAAIALAPAILVYVAGVVGILVTPFVFMAQRELRGLDTLRTVHNQIRKQVARMQFENDKLSNSIDELEGGVSRLKESEQQFSAIAETQGVTVDRLVSLVDENQKTLTAMKVALRREVSQDLIQKIMESDTDEDMKITEFEIDILIMHLTSLDSVESIEEERFRAKVEESGGSMAGVLNIVRDMLSDNDDDNSIIKVTVDKIASQAGK